MSLSRGSKLGAFEIQSRLGTGGMGEVYRAISALNHPNICALHDLGQQDGVAFLVMECVEGTTLAERLAAGPLPLDEALAVGRQLAAALQAAHERGIVHRDLKPGNVMLTKTGVKVLDFGLAKDVGGQPIAGSPTITHASATQAGTILGTAGYMLNGGEIESHVGGVGEQIVTAPDRSPRLAGSRPARARRARPSRRRPTGAPRGPSGSRSPAGVHSFLLHKRWMYTFHRMDEFLQRFIGKLRMTTDPPDPGSLNCAAVRGLGDRRAGSAHHVLDARRPCRASRLPSS